MIESLPADDAVPSSRYSTSSRSWSQEKFLERSLVSCGNVDTLAATKFDLSICVIFTTQRYHWFAGR